MVGFSMVFTRMIEKLRNKLIEMESDYTANTEDFVYPPSIARAEMHKKS